MPYTIKAFNAEFKADPFSRPRWQTGRINFYEQTSDSLELIISDLNSIDGFGEHIRELTAYDAPKDAVYAVVITQTPGSRRGAIWAVYKD